MSFEVIIESTYYTYLILPILIFLARVVDQSIGILRIIFATKGLKYSAFIAGFFESLIWLLAIGQIIHHVDNVFGYLAFAFGFATGNFVGIYLEQRISIGYVVIRVVFNINADETIKLLKKSDFRISIVNVEVMGENTKMIFSTIQRKELNTFVAILTKHNPAAFYTVEDTKSVKEGYLNRKTSIFKKNTVRK